MPNHGSGADVIDINLFMSGRLSFLSPEPW